MSCEVSFGGETEIIHDSYDGEQDVNNVITMNESMYFHKRMCIHVKWVQ